MPVAMILSRQRRHPSSSSLTMPARMFAPARDGSSGHWRKGDAVTIEMAALDPRVDRRNCPKIRIELKATRDLREMTASDAWNDAEMTAIGISNNPSLQRVCGRSGPRPGLVGRAEHWSWKVLQQRQREAGGRR